MHYNGAGSDYYERGDPLQLRNVKTHEKSFFGKKEKTQKNIILFLSLDFLIFLFF